MSFDFKPFHVKLPVFMLEGGMRGILVSASAGPTGMVTAHLFCTDGTQKTMMMQASRVQKAVQQGPFVVLIEQRDVSGTALAEMSSGGILDPDGNPVR